MKSQYCLILFTWLLAACSTTPSGNALPNAKVQTEMARPTKTFVFNPTATPTPIPLDELDFSSILVQPNDLPEGYVGGQVTDGIPIYIDVRYKLPYQIHQEFEKNNENAGDVTVMIFNHNDIGNAVFGIAYDMYGAGEVEHVEEGMLLSKDLHSSENRVNSPVNPPAKLTGMDLMFSRCDTVVYIRILDLENQDDIVSYAQRLDERLTPLVCR